MQFDIITIFPGVFSSYFTTSILKRAQEKKRVKIAVHNLRDYTTDKPRAKANALARGRRQTVDDSPYGGGAGMVLKVEPLYRAVTTLKSKVRKVVKSKVILLAANGKQFDERMAEKFAKLGHIIFICGHYEGVDARVMKFVDEAISVGPYVLTGGELPAMTIVDAVTRLIPGVLGNPESLKEESFTSPQPSPTRRGRKSGDKKKITTNYKLQTINSKEYPHYTRPEVFVPKRGMRWAVPKVLLSGDHKKIAQWREKQRG